MIKYAIFFIAFTLASCGIEDFYYLPQVPQISGGDVVKVEFTIPSIDLTDFFYATGYAIYYKIYISTDNYAGFSQIISDDQRRNIHPELQNHFARIFPHTDPTRDTVSVDRLFRELNYHRLVFENPATNLPINNFIDTSGGSFLLDFISDTPNASHGSLNVSLRRNSNVWTNNEYRFFQNRVDLNQTISGSRINADVQTRNVSSQDAYVNMYIVAIGINPVDFSLIYSKPTHIGIFRLPG